MKINKALSDNPDYLLSMVYASGLESWVQDNFMYQKKIQRS